MASPTITAATLMPAEIFPVPDQLHLFHGRQQHMDDAAGDQQAERHPACSRNTGKLFTNDSIAMSMLPSLRPPLSRARLTRFAARANASRHKLNTLRHSVGQVFGP